MHISPLFASARIKLTLGYTLFFATVFIIFSVFIFHAQMRILERRRMLPPHIAAKNNDFAQERLNLAVRDMQIVSFRALIVLNVIALVMGAAGAYFLAGFSLQPLESAYQKQKQFLQDVSHELRTPLSVMQVELDVATRHLTGKKKEISPHMFQKTLDSLGEEVTLLSNLVGNMLQLSRIDNHEKNLGPVQTDIAMLIPTVLAQFDAVAENKNVRLESVSNTVESVTLQTDAPQQRMVSGSYEQWQQVLRILLDNAIKYTPAGGSVTVGFKVHGKQAHVTVTDTGIGINPHEVDTIFERFYRADTARTIPGSGLGLAIARELVQQLNGKLVVTSTVGKGSTFTVQAPLA